jgi:hypothetical protein
VELAELISHDGNETIRVHEYQHAGVLLHLKWGLECKHAAEIKKAVIAARMCATAVDYVAAVVNMFRLIKCEIEETSWRSIAWTIASVRKDWPDEGLAVDPRDLSELSDDELKQEFLARSNIYVHMFAKINGLDKKIFGRWIKNGPNSYTREEAALCADVIRKWIADSRIQL